MHILCVSTEVCQLQGSVMFFLPSGGVVKSNIFWYKLLKRKWKYYNYDIPIAILKCTFSLAIAQLLDL